MNARLFALPLIVFTAVSAKAGDAQPGDSGIADLVTYPAAASPWRLGAGYAQLFGLKTSFTGLGRFNSQFAAQPLGGGVNYDYDNGFVHVDSSGNAVARTWNWGYQNSRQYNPAGSGSMDFSLINSNANGNTDEHGGSDPGIEVFFYYDMGQIGFNPLQERKVSWGFRGGFHYSHINVNNSDLIATDLNTTTDTFSLNRTIPPSAPYAGSFGGPGPLLGDHPVRIIGGGSGLVSGNRELDVHLTIANAGTFLEMPVTEKFDVMLEAGVSLAVGAGSYNYFGTTNVTGLRAQQSSGSESLTRFLPGVYIGFSGIYELTKEWSVQCSGRYQYMDNYNLDANGSQASLSFGSAFIFSIGGIYSF